MDDNYDNYDELAYAFIWIMGGIFLLVVILIAITIIGNPSLNTDHCTYTFHLPNGGLYTARGSKFSSGSRFHGPSFTTDQGIEMNFDKWVDVDRTNCDEIKKKSSNKISL